ncbi:hypothetical protein AKJ16_DCAP08922, partial [Drosera capensis]
MVASASLESYFAVSPALAPYRFRRSDIGAFDNKGDRIVALLATSKVEILVLGGMNSTATAASGSISACHLDSWR